MDYDHYKSVIKRLLLIEDKLPEGYSVNIGIIITENDEIKSKKLTLSKLIGSYKPMLLTDIYIDKYGNCLKNRYGNHK